jgi:hypothetical protein
MSITGAESISQNARSAYRKQSIEWWDNSGAAKLTKSAEERRELLPPAPRESPSRRPYSSNWQDQRAILFFRIRQEDRA